MKTLIITVGTRQVGWRCTDGIVRSLGADGGSVPPHVDELYQLVLEQVRGHYPDKQAWGVRHLAEQLHALCQINQDFSPVELLLDQSLINKEIQHGLTQIVLWGTNQPEDVSWKFRRLDTFWSAKLMAGKLQQIYPTLQVEVWCPVLSANNPVEICQTVEEFIMQSIADKTANSETSSYTLLIENKGSTPAIASALEMCAVALSRQCHVQLILPQEPNPSFIPRQNGFQDAQVSTQHSYLPIGQYFWPLEKPQIISAWSQGDFGEARLWLAAHRDRHKILYDLSEYLVLAVNGNTKLAITQIKNHWLGTKAVKKLIDSENYKQWLILAESLQTKNQTKNNRYAWIWERMFLFEINLEKQLYANAFLAFSWALEALLNLQYEMEEWPKRGYMDPTAREYPPSLYSLLKGWERKHLIEENQPWNRCLDEIRKMRNKIAHEGIAVSKEEVSQVLSLHQSQQSITGEVNASALRNQMHFVLDRVAHPVSKVPSEILLRSLYQWGLHQLNEGQ